MDHRFENMPGAAAAILMGQPGMGPATYLKLAGRLLAASGDQPLTGLSLMTLLPGSRVSSRILSLPPDLQKTLCREALGDAKGRKAAVLLEAASAKDPREAVDSLSASGLSFISVEDPDWPQRLLTIPDPPVCLYYKGRLPDPGRPSLAVIGSRYADGYGRDMTRVFTEYLAARGVQIISGLARGVDGIAGRSALRAGGLSFAVLGSGPDICYPPENRDLYEDLALRGGILSEYRPGTIPRAALFPHRNRIISGLADAVLVVEAGLDSGTMITTGHALDQGKDIFAVPGRVPDRLSRGCNELIRQGAFIASAPEVLSEYFFGVMDSAPAPIKEAGERQTDLLPPAQAAVYAVLDQGCPLDLDAILPAASKVLGRTLSTGEGSSALTMLVLKGLAREEGRGCYRKSFMT